MKIWLDQFFATHIDFNVVVVVVVDRPWIKSLPSGMESRHESILFVAGTYAIKDP